MNGDWMHTMDAEGLTPLDRALACGHRVLAEVMLDQEDEDRRDRLSGSTPLHRACCLGLSLAVSSLLQYDADASVSDATNEQPLHKAVRGGHHDVAEMLLPESDVNQASSRGLTPLHWACIAGDADMVQLLIEAGADPYRESSVLDGLSPAELAAVMGYLHLRPLLGVTRTYV